MRANRLYPRKHALFNAVRVVSPVLAAWVVFLFASALAAPAEARGGFSRGSAASGGFSSDRSSRVAAPTVSDRVGSGRQGELGDRLEERADQIRDRRQGRNDFQDHFGDDYDYGYGWDGDWDAAPADDLPALSNQQGGYLTTLPCSGASVVVNDNVYYECAAMWYRRGFLGGTVVYLASGPPPGHMD